MRLGRKGEVGSLYVAVVPRPLVLVAASDGTSRARGRFVSFLGVLNGRVS